MSKEITKDFDGNRPFEERVFARFDGIESFLRSLDTRVQVLESHSYDTKPIWERALKEILETRLEMGELKNEVAGVKARVTGIESELEGVKKQVREIKRELKHEVTKRLDRLLSLEHGNRADIMDAEERIDELESKLA